MRQKHGGMHAAVGEGTVHLAFVGVALDHVQAGRIRAALDVTDPEPLPESHPLWGAAGVLISPHVGGASSAMHPRIAALVKRLR